MPGGTSAGWLMLVRNMDVNVTHTHTHTEAAIVVAVLHQAPRREDVEWRGGRAALVFTSAQELDE